MERSNYNTIREACDQYCESLSDRDGIIAKPAFTIGANYVWMVLKEIVYKSSERDLEFRLKKALEDLHG